MTSSLVDSGFERDFVLADINLAPGAKQTVSMPLSYSQLAYWDGTGKVQPGTVHIMVGGSSADVRAVADLTVQ